MLYSIQVPKKGGDTLFADQYAAYDDLPSSHEEAASKALLRCTTTATATTSTRARAPSPRCCPRSRSRRWPGCATRWRASHPVTGRTALYAVSGSSFGIEGMPDDEAVDLLDELKRHATQEKYQLRLKYGVGDVVIWDNARCCIRRR